MFPLVFAIIGVIGFGLALLALAQRSAGNRSTVAAVRELAQGVAVRTDEQTRLIEEVLRQIDTLQGMVAGQFRDLGAGVRSLDDRMSVLADKLDEIPDASGYDPTQGGGLREPIQAWRGEAA